MASHKLKINYDDTTGTVTMSHRCTVDVAGHAVGHELPIDPPPSMAGVLKAMLDGNRDEMEKQTATMAVQHAAAVAGKAKPGVKQLAVAGGLGAAGAAK